MINQILRKHEFSTILKVEGVRYYALHDTYDLNGGALSFHDVFRGLVEVNAANITEVVYLNNIRPSDNNLKFVQLTADINDKAAVIPGSVELLRNASDLEGCFNSLLFCNFYQLPLQYPITTSGIDVTSFRQRHIDAVHANYQKYLAYVTNGDDVQKEVLLRVIEDTYNAFLKRVNSLKTVKKIYAEWPNMFLPAPTFYNNVVL